MDPAPPASYMPPCLHCIVVNAMLTDSGLINGRSECRVLDLVIHLEDRLCASWASWSSSAET